MLDWTGGWDELLPCVMAAAADTAAGAVAPQAAAAVERPSHSTMSSRCMKLR